MNPILDILDKCAEVFTFPMLDNGYVYLAASRLTAYYGESDWALVIEVFGFSPRAGAPDLAIHTFGSSIRNRNAKENYVSNEAYENYLKIIPIILIKLSFQLEVMKAGLTPKTMKLLCPMEISL